MGVPEEWSAGMVGAKTQNAEVGQSPRAGVLESEKACKMTAISLIRVFSKPFEWCFEVFRSEREWRKFVASVLVAFE